MDKAELRARLSRDRRRTELTEAQRRDGSSGTQGESMQDESTKVLIVEGGSRDDVELAAILESAGFLTRVASEGESALGLLVSWQPAVVVVDLRFPAREARRFCAAVAERPEAALLL